jgi:adenine nucleotide transporter 17
LAGAFAQIFTIPVSVIALRQQIADSKSSSKSLLQVGSEIVHESGWTGLWTGLKPGLVLTVNPAITYGVFERIKAVVLERDGRIGGRLTVGESFWIGVGSKTLATVVTYPYIFVGLLFQAGLSCLLMTLKATNCQAKVRLQAKSKSKSNSPPSSGSTTTSAPSSLHESYAEIASHTPAPDAPVLPEHEKQDEEKSISPPTLAPPVLTGNSLSGKGKGEGEGAIALLAKVYREKGVAGWYKGLGAQIIKAVLCQGKFRLSRFLFSALTIFADSFRYLVCVERSIRVIHGPPTRSSSSTTGEDPSCPLGPDCQVVIVDLL